MATGDEGRAQRAFRVLGRVQGVGFRWWTRRTASGLGLGGWVRNEPDGSVVVQAVGPPDGLERLAVALREGPMGSRVDRLDEIVPTGTLTPDDFRIEM